MKYSIILILVALLQYIYFTFRVGLSRGKYEIHAPKTVGHDIWERMYRVQQNTLEQLIIYIPGMVLFSMYVSEKWVVIPGVLYIIGRVVYSYLYIANPEKRAPGVFLSFFSNIALVVGALIGVTLSLL